LFLIYSQTWLFKNPSRMNSLLRVFGQGVIRACISWTENQHAAKIAPQPMVFPSTLTPNRSLLQPGTSGFTVRATAGGEHDVAREAFSGARNNNKL
jgi:hypothetical protein